MWLKLLVLSSISVVVPDMGEFAKSLIESNHHTVAVFPEVLKVTDEGDYQFALATQQSREEMDRIHTRLERVANQRLKFVDLATVAGASREFKASDLRDDDTKLQILRNTNAEVLILGVQTSDEEVAAEMNLVAWAPPAPMANPQFDVSYRHDVHHSLSDLAFAGKSFELRRWNGQALTLPGFRADVADKKELVGLGYQHELRQAQSLRPSLPHPLSIKGFPIRMETLVNKQKRAIVPIGDSYYLTANDGETVEFYFQNNSAHQVLLGLYIDGENTFGKRYQHPLQTPTENHWVLAADGKNYAVRSWHSPAKGEQCPIIVRRQPGPTGGRSAGDPSGTITAIFYTNGTEGIDVPPPIQVRGVNIEAGEPEPAQLRTMPGRKGLMLAAVTIHYRSSDEMRALRGQGGP